jgi:CHAT domain-containing protein
VSFRVKDTLSYTHYWKPISELLPPETKTIYLSHDGIFNKVNLHVLLNPETDTYVLDMYAIRLLSSTRDLLTEKNLSISSYERAYLFGYPTYNLENTSSSGVTDTSQMVEELGGIPFSDRIEMLPGTRTEVNNLHNLLQTHAWGAKKYIGKAAREEKVKSIRNPKLLHLATHGFFLSDLEVDEKTDQKAYGIHLDNIKANPLLRSGLLFTGASNTISGYAQAASDIISTLEAGDGILTAYEVMNMDLDGTDLVVLSACETGLGEVKNGEGVYGLQRAFLVAGAQSIIMSLWRVDDEATQKLMQYFYERWVTGEDKYSAFIQALRSFKKEYPEPYYWGAFVMAGK